MEYHSLFDNGKTIAAAIRGKYAIAVSDGSFGAATGTLAFILEGENLTGQVVGVNVIHGSPEDQSYLHSELAGIYGIIISANVICQEHQMLEGRSKWDVTTSKHSDVPLTWTMSSPRSTPTLTSPLQLDTT